MGEARRGQVQPVLSRADKLARAEALRHQLGRFRAGVEPLRLAHERLLPVEPALEPAFPDGGMVRGSVVEVDGSAASSLAWSLVAAATRGGCWVALVGVAELGLMAGHELGVDLGRCLLVDPGPSCERWAAAVAALVGAADLVITRPHPGVGERELARLRARCRERGTTLVQLPGSSQGWRPDRRLEVTGARWVGLGMGEGRLVARHLSLRVEGRGAAGRARSFGLWLPGPHGAVATADEPALRSVVVEEWAS